MTIKLTTNSLADKWRSLFYIRWRAIVMCLLTYSILHTLVKMKALSIRFDIASPILLTFPRGINTRNLHILFHSWENRIRIFHAASCVGPHMIFSAPYLEITPNAPMQPQLWNAGDRSHADRLLLEPSGVKVNGSETSWICFSEYASECCAICLQTWIVKCFLMGLQSETEHSRRTLRRHLSEASKRVFHPTTSGPSEHSREGIGWWC